MQSPGGRTTKLARMIDEVAFPLPLLSCETQADAVKTLTSPPYELSAAQASFVLDASHRSWIASDRTALQAELDALDPG